MIPFTAVSTVLLENTEKEDTKHPDFKGGLIFGGTKYNASIWLKINKKNEPFLSLCLSLPNTPHDQDSNISLWQKTNRTNTEPHFRGRETWRDVPLVFSAWVVFEGEQGSVRIEVTEAGGTVTDALKQTRSRLKAFIQQADQPSAPVSTNELGEPDSIPF